MSWSYANSPATVPRDELRFLIGDTIKTAQMISNEELDYALALHPKQTGKANYSAAALAAQTVASKFSAKRSKTVGSLSISYAEQITKYQEMANRLSKWAASGIDGKGGGRSLPTPVLLGGGATVLGPNDESNDSYSN